MKSARLLLPFAAARFAVLATVQVVTPSANHDLLLLAKPGALARVTESPIPMQPQVAMASASVRKPGHSQLLPKPAAVFQVYVTPAAVTAMTAPKPAFPVGTILLKQKFSAANAQEPELYTGMLKQEKGFNPDCGDWEFFTLNGTGTAVTARGKIESCMECHKSYPQSDFVTRDYPIKLPAPPAKKP